MPLKKKGGLFFSAFGWNVRIFEISVFVGVSTNKGTMQLKKARQHLCQAFMLPIALRHNQQPEYGLQ